MEIPDKSLWQYLGAEKGVPDSGTRFEVKSAGGMFVTAIARHSAKRQDIGYEWHGKRSDFLSTFRKLKN